MRKIITVFLLCLFFLSDRSFLTAQATVLDFDTRAASDEEKAKTIESLNLRVVEDDSHRAGIKCFDISQNGDYALALGEDSNSRVYVYDSDGVFLYGYVFDPQGDYGIEFVGNDVAIYLVRGDRYAVYNSTGVCVDVQIVHATKQHYEFRREVLDRKYKKVLENEYFLEREIELRDTYSRLVMINGSGERSVLFDASASNLATQIFTIALIITFFSLCVYTVVKKIKEEEEMEEDTSE